MKTFSLPSPAKINHFLHITGRRSDGYHLLQTGFQFLEYGDTLHFSARDDDAIVVNMPENYDVPLEQNLIYKSAIALRLHAGCSQGVTIDVDKRLPMGAGIGGGSSNAATTLVALNELWQIHWPLPKLLQLGVTLGADIPIFLYGHSALGEGIGDELSPLPFKEDWVLIVVPPCHCSSAKLYASLDLTRDTPRLRIEHLAKPDGSSVRLRNDFEPLVRRYYPEVDAAIKWLSNYGNVRLSGSGASVFTCFDSRDEAEQIARAVPKECQRFVAKGKNISPLRQIAENLDFSVYNATCFATEL
jgi:4-diphosphocytidyl-2-C-methyl-D-erythritol kinase